MLSVVTHRRAVFYHMATLCVKQLPVPVMKMNLTWHVQNIKALKSAKIVLSGKDVLIKMWAYDFIYLLIGSKKIKTHTNEYKTTIKTIQKHKRQT